MVKPDKWPVRMLFVLSGGVVLGGIAQLELPLLLKEVALMLPLQIAALLYVAWYWRDRRSPPPLVSPSTASPVPRRCPGRSTDGTP